MIAATPEALLDYPYNVFINKSSQVIFKVVLPVVCGFKN